MVRLVRQTDILDIQTILDKTLIIYYILWLSRAYLIIQIGLYLQVILYLLFTRYHAIATCYLSVTILKHLLMKLKHTLSWSWFSSILFNSSSSYSSSRPRGRPPGAKNKAESKSSSKRSHHSPSPSSNSASPKRIPIYHNAHKLHCEEEIAKRARLAALGGLPSDTPPTLKPQVPIPNSLVREKEQYSGDPNTGRVWYSNGRHLCHGRIRLCMRKSSAALSFFSLHPNLFSLLVWKK